MLQGFCSETSSLILSVIQKASLSNDFIIFNYHGRILFMFFFFITPVYPIRNLIFIFNLGNNIFHYLANKKHYNEQIREGHMHETAPSIENICFRFSCKQLLKSCSGCNKCAAAFFLFPGQLSTRCHCQQPVRPPRDPATHSLFSHSTTRDSRPLYPPTP